MPTPRPIMAAICGVNSGMVVRLDTNTTRALPDARPTRAVPMGRPIASTDPNAIKRMMAAECLGGGHLLLLERLAAVLDPQTLELDLGSQCLDLVRAVDRVGERVLGE